MVIEFPLSSEAALCGVYIFTSSTRVGLKSKEALRRDFLTAYEDKYKEGLEQRNRRKVLELQAKAKSATPAEPAVAETSASFFMSMVQGLKSPEPVVVEDVEAEDAFVDEFEDSVWDDEPEDFEYEPEEEPDGEWVSSGTELFSVKVDTPVVQSPAVVKPVEPDYDWVSSGTELFSISCASKESPAVEPQSVFEDEEAFEESFEDEFEDEEFVEDSSGESSDLWEDAEESDIWDDEDDGAFDVEEPAPVVSEENVFEDADEEFDSFTDEEELPPVIETPKVVPKVPEPVREPPRRVSPVGQPARQPEEQALTRLDEGAIREFVKNNRLCSEADICKAFSGHDSTKVRQCIKSALRKFRIFEKHGRFTV